MPSRNFFQYFLISLKGVAMGAADVVPGVSGGTIAFISGIYEELIATIHKLDFGFFKNWRRNGLRQAWIHYNLSFLLALFLGVAVSILSLAKLIGWLLHNHPILVWAFFFGLILASIIYVGRQITRWNVRVVIGIVLAAAAAYAITLAKPIGSPDSNWFLFVAGFVAIIAMILPGISGAFILLLLGAYAGVIKIVSDLTEGISSLNWDIFSQAFLKIAIFGIGAIFGLKAFSRVLNWMFDHYKNLTLAVLTGFMIGALNKIWPWKQVLEYRTNHDGEQVPLLEKSVLPGQFDGTPEIGMALLCMLLGFLSIFIIERLARKKAN